MKKVQGRRGKQDSAQSAALCSTDSQKIADALITATDMRSDPAGPAAQGRIAGLGRRAHSHAGKVFAGWESVGVPPRKDSYPAMTRCYAEVSDEGIKLEAAGELSRVLLVQRFLAVHRMSARPRSLSRTGDPQSNRYSVPRIEGHNANLSIRNMSVPRPPDCMPCLCEHSPGTDIASQ